MEGATLGGTASSRAFTAGTGVIDESTVDRVIDAAAVLNAVVGVGCDGAGVAMLALEPRPERAAASIVRLTPSSST